MKQFAYSVKFDTSVNLNFTVILQGYAIKSEAVFQARKAGQSAIKHSVARGREGKQALAPRCAGARARCILTRHRQQKGG